MVPFVETQLNVGQKEVTSRHSLPNQALHHETRFLNVTDFYDRIKGPHIQPYIPHHKESPSPLFQSLTEPCES
jgi:hypothetical protein